MFPRLAMMSPFVLVLTQIAPAAEPDPRLAGYRIAPGYKVEIAATEPLVVNPVSMTWGPDGRLYVIEWQAGRGPNDHVKVLTDADGDGTFDKVDMYMDGLDLPAGLCFWDGWTYLSLDHDVVRFADKDGDGRFETREAVVTGFGNDDSHHRVSGLTIGPDGWLYMTTGDSDAKARGSDGSTSTVLRSGGVFRCTPEGKHLEVVAFGMRNPWGNVAFDDEFHIFHTDNDNEGSPGFTGCRLLHVVEGGDYGWRLREGARCCNPDFERATWNGGRPGRLGWMAETGRGAPAGLCVLNSAAFPPSTRNLLIYPDVFRKSVRAYRLQPEGAAYKVAEEFELLASSEGLFRPDDAEIGPDGALYILDWRTDSGGAGQLAGNGKTGRIYRVTWGGTETEPARKILPRDRFIRLVRAEEKAVVQALRSDDFGMRRAASLELVRRLRGVRGEPGALPPFGPDDSTTAGDLLRLVGFEIPRPPVEGVPQPPPRPLPPPATRRHALITFMALAGQGASLDGVRYARNTAHFADDPTLRRLAYEWIARWENPANLQGVYDLLEYSGKEQDSQAQRARCLALGRFSRLPRARPGRPQTWNEARAEYDRLFKAGKAPEHPVAADFPPTPELPGEADPDPERIERLRRVQNRLREMYVRLLDTITLDLVAQELVGLAATASVADPFLRDGFTRGLERLGPAGINALVEATKSPDATWSAAALYALQSWRTKDGVAAVLAEATIKAALPPSARVGLFRALRELVSDVPPEPIIAWLRDTPGADPAARVEAIHVVAALPRTGHFPVVPVLPALLTDESATVRQAALGLADKVRSAEAKAALVRLASNAQGSAEERRLALQALRGYEDKTLAPALSELFGTSQDPGFLAELLRTLAALDFSAAARRAETLLDSNNADLRHEAIGLLGQKPQTALLVANRYNAGKLPREDLGGVIEAVHAHATPELQAAVQAMLKDTLLAAPKGEEAQRLRDYVGRHGNPGRGKAIYFDTKKGGCTTCHRMEGVGGSVGPDLTRVWETLSFDKRVESILEPSKEIKEGFATTKVVTTNGQVLTGLLVESTVEGVTLKDAQGREVKVPAAEIEQKGTDPVSLMPVGVVGHLSFAELADLLAFLGDRAAQESLKTK
jgi:putative membrane-bound dehydrogenase-like protein